MKKLISGAISALILLILLFFFPGFISGFRFGFIAQRLQKKCVAESADQCKELVLLNFKEKRDRVEDSLIVALNHLNEACSQKRTESCVARRELKASIDKFGADERCQAGDWNVCYQLAYAFHQLGDYDRSFTYDRMACERTKIDACSNAAADLLEAGKYEEGIVYAKKACNDTVGIGCYNLARAYAHLDQIDEALSSFSRAVKFSINGKQPILRKVEIETDLDFTKLLSNPEFQKLLAQLR